MTAMLQVDGVGKRFGGLTALDDVTFAIEPGTRVGIIGPNGAGKSTLFNMISGFDTVTTGTVSLRGERITGWAPHKIARAGLARTFQTVRPFPGLTVLENLTVGGLKPGLFDFRSEVVSVAREALEVAERLRLTSVLSERVETLSYGTLKLLEIGRALMLKAPMALFDEPFAGVSGQEANRLLEVIRDEGGRGTTILIIEHKLRMLMQLVERVLVLDYGKLIADAAPAVVVRNPRVQEAYLGKNWEKAIA